MKDKSENIVMKNVDEVTNTKKAEISHLNKAMESYDVIIVGCGPVGATLANYLKLYGHNVAIFDRDKEPFPVPRATLFDDETVRTYQEIGILNRIHEEDHIYEGDISISDSKNRILMSYDRYNTGEDLISGRCGHYQMTMIDQPGVERVLRDSFNNGSDKVDAYYGYEVLSVTNGDQKARIVTKNLDTEEEQEFEAEYIIGCDGGQSLVRRTLGVDRVDIGYTEDYLVVDAYVDDDDYYRTRIPDGAIIYLDPKKCGVICKGLHNHVRFDFLRHPAVMKDAASKDENDFAEAARDLIISRGHDPNKFRIVRHAPYSFYAGMPSKWRVGRLLVAGDAAHQTPPWSGQGVNMGTRDTANLSFKLHLVLSGKASDKLLDTYDEERRPASMKTIQGAVDMGKLMQTANPIKTTIRNFVFSMGGRSRLVNRKLFKNWQRKPTFTDGFLGKTSHLAGSPMIQPIVDDINGKSHLLDDLVGLNFALITTNSPMGKSVYRFRKELNGTVLKLGMDFEDPDETLLQWFRKNKVNAVLVRPDRYIFDAGVDCDSLCETLFRKLK
ncbi:MAG: bifunctional 3-(3-hydroxy-phenyl)propionate/3-hydroxycinnamic acid hydroxylase [Candidatus Thiodiazotropha sp.]